MPGFEIFGDEERNEVQDVLNTGVLFRYGFDQARKGQWKVRDFEEELAKRLSVGHCLLCASGTAALAIALASCGIGAGDEVIVPPFTFIATIESILSAGAVPVFAEIDETLCLDPEAVKAAITPRSKAVIAVHMCGSMAQIDLIKQVCDEKGLILIEDACQALGATYKGQAVGTFGKIGCFSFDSVKTVTCGEGGAVVTPDKVVYKCAEQYADHGHNHEGTDRGLEEHPILGTNLRISELNAAVGLAQLRKLDMMLKTQRANKEVLVEALSQFSEVSFQRIPDPAGDSATFLSFLLPDEERAREVAGNLGNAGVDGCFYWYDNNWHYFRQWQHLKNLESAAKLPLELLEEVPDYSTVNLPRSDRIMGRVISMQIKLAWTQKDMETRISKIGEIFKK